MVDWDSMGCVIAQTHGHVFQTLDRVFQTLGRAFQILGQAFSFLLNPQKLDRVFQNRG